MRTSNHDFKCPKIFAVGCETPRKSEELGEGEEERRAEESNVKGASEKGGREDRVECAREEGEAATSDVKPRGEVN